MIQKKSGQMTLDESSPFATGTRWQTKAARVDGTRLTVSVIGTVGERHVEVEDEATGKKKVLIRESLTVNYERIPAPRESSPEARTIQPISTITMRISPALAAKWLSERNPEDHNRPFDRKHASDLAAEILAGRWKLTHQGIAFSSDGKLKDGQHRLNACVSANKSIWLRVTYHLDSGVDAEMVPSEAPVAMLDHDIGGPIDCGKFRPAFVQVGLSGDRDFARAKRIQSIIGALGTLEGKADKMTAGHYEAAVVRHGAALEWAYTAVPPRFPASGPAALAHAWKRPDTRPKIEALAAILSSKDFTADVRGNAFAIYEMMTGKAAAGGAPARNVATARVSTSKQDVMRKILRFAQAFCEGKSINKAYATELGVKFFERRP